MVSVCMNKYTHTHTHTHTQRTKFTRHPPQEEFYTTNVEVIPHHECAGGDADPAVRMETYVPGFLCTKQVLGPVLA